MDVEAAQDLLGPLPRGFGAAEYRFGGFGGAGILFTQLVDHLLRVFERELDAPGGDHVANQHDDHFRGQLLLLHPLVGQHGLAAVQLPPGAEQVAERPGKFLVGSVLRRGLLHQQRLLDTGKPIHRRLILHPADQTATLPVSERLFHVGPMHFQRLGQIVQHALFFQHTAVSIHQAIQIDLYIAVRGGGHKFAQKGVGDRRSVPEQGGGIALEGGHVEKPLLVQVAAVQTALLESGGQVGLGAHQRGVQGGTLLG